MLAAQWLAMTGLTVRRTLGGGTFWSIMAIAAAPTALAFLLAIIVMLRGGPESMPPDYTGFVAKLFTGGYVHFGLFFIPVLFGNALVREEITNQTFHYFLLTTMPRWIFVAGKFAGFMAVAIPVLLLNLVAYKLLIYGLASPPGTLGTAMFSPSGLRIIALESLTVVCSLAVYTALFMVLGSIFKNMMFALFIYAWEITSNMLPELLRNFTLSYHLKAMLPHQASERPGFIGIVVEAPPTLQVVLVLTLTFATCMALAVWMTNWRQCLYGKD